MVEYQGTPHPDYPNMVWSAPQVEPMVMQAVAGSETPAEVARSVMTVLDAVGYDSMDREMAFWIAHQTKGFDYNEIYDAWLES